MAEHVDLPLGDDVPDQIKELVEGIKFFVPDCESDEEREVYDRALEGRCMTCSAELGQTTMVVVNLAGIIMIYCGGACYSDMQIIHWVLEQHQDLVDKIKFRGGIDPDGPEEVP